MKLRAVLRTLIGRLNLPAQRVAVLLVAAAGCAELSRMPDGTASALEFELSGRIAVRYRDEATSGNIAWRHARETDEMLITTPLGSSVARIVRKGDGGVVLTTANGQEYRAEDAEALTDQVLGFRVPLIGLADWVRGRPSGATPAGMRHDGEGRLIWLEQGGWNVEYLEYRDADRLPARMKLTYPGLELRVAVHAWKLP